MNYLNQNIRYLRKENRLTQEEMAATLDVKRPMIGSYEEGRAVPKIAVIQKLSAFFNVSIDELVNHDLSKGYASAKRAKGTQLRVLSTVVGQENNELVTLIPVKASAGYLCGYSDPEYIGSMPRFSMPFPELSRDRTYRVFQIKGESMLPVPSGAYIVCVYVQDWTGLKDGKTHIVITSGEGIVYKRVFNQIDEKRSLLLKSDNPDYKPYEVSVESVLEVWKALGYLSFDLPDAAMGNVQSLSNMILGMREEIAKLRKASPLASGGS